MKELTERSGLWKRGAAVAMGIGLVALCASAQESEETEVRIRIAASNMEDAVVVDCQLPGKLRRLGGTRTYLTPGRLIRTSAIVCRTRGGEYTLGDLASGTLSLKRWIVPAEAGDAEAQYYVARIHANGMDNVPVNFAEAARWYEMAANQGYVEAKQELGYLYEQGLGVEKDLLKALNLQRDASGLGEDLDYAYKIADAQALVDDLAAQLLAANGALQDSQLELREMQDRLSVARSSARNYEVQMVGLVAELDQARQATGGGSSAEVNDLEAQVAQLSAELQKSQSAVLDLEQERNSASAEMSIWLASGQATQLELRELLTRTEVAEGEVKLLSTQLAEAQQRLIQSDEELRQLQSAYREQTDGLSSARARLLEARTRTDSDGKAYIAAAEAEVASKAARINSLEARVSSLQSQLAASDNSAAEDALRAEIGTLQSRYDNDIADLKIERDRLKQSYVASEGERSVMFDESRQQLAQRDVALNAQKRQLDTLVAESQQLRARVGELEAEQINVAQRSNQDSAKLQADLSVARQRVTTLSTDLERARAEKAALESKLLADRIELQEQLGKDSARDAQTIKILRAEVAAAESTIDLQNLKIAKLEQDAADGNVQLARIKGKGGIVETPPVMTDAMAVLAMARSREKPDLGEFHALLIANEAYQNLAPLTTPIKDVRVIEKLLVEGYGFNVKVLTNATRNQIMESLQEYSNTLTANDNLLIYYAGRGSTPDGPPDRAYWQGVDADPSERYTWVLAEHVSEKIKQFEAKRIFLVTDSCFSRRRVQAKSMAVGRGLNPETFELLARQPARFVLTSGANVPVFDENGDRTHSLFAKQFVEILRQNKNVLSAEMLSYEMSSRLRERAVDPDRATPIFSQLSDAGHRGGEFFFVPNPKQLLAASAEMGQDTA